MRPVLGCERKTLVAICCTSSILLQPHVHTPYHTKQDAFAPNKQHGLHGESASTWKTLRLIGIVIISIIMTSRQRIPNSKMYSPCGVRRPCAHT